MSPKFLHDSSSSSPRPVASFDRKPAPGRRARAGFTLVEVALSLGIFTFGITAVIGLLPMGLMTFRQAKDTSVGAEIAQRLFSEWEQMDFDTMLKASLSSNSYRQ